MDRPSRASSRTPPAVEIARSIGADRKGGAGRLAQEPRRHGGEARGLAQPGRGRVPRPSAGQAAGEGVPGQVRAEIHVELRAAPGSNRLAHGARQGIDRTTLDAGFRDHGY
ncbi:hypothetical protein P8609_18615, partial [Lysobacter sp. UC]